MTGPTHDNHARVGATPEEWFHLDVMLGLGDDLLPVVSNVKATISPKSALTELGKVPSHYNRAGMAVGFTEWPKRHSTATEIATWSSAPDYGICVITREARALDVDVTDVLLAQEVEAFLVDHFGYRPPKRYRRNSAKFLVPFRMVSDDPQYSKWVINLRTTEEESAGKKDQIEILMTGHQFVACGTHPSGARIEWEGGLPTEIPALTPDEFEALVSRLQDRFGKQPLKKQGDRLPRIKGEHLAIDDPVVSHLEDKGISLGRGRDGGLLVICPWADAHTMGEAGDESTLYYPAGSNGYTGSGFRCLHGHCVDRSTDDFLEAVGLGSREDRRIRQQKENQVIGSGDSFSPLPDVLSIEQMLDRFVFLKDGSWVFDSLHPKHTTKLADFRNATAASFSESQTGAYSTGDGKPKTKRIPNATGWLSHTGRKSAFSTTFKAGGGLYVADPRGRDSVNTWVGFPRVVDGSKGDPSRVLAHIRWLFAERADDFLDWLAHIEQNPGVLPHTAWLHIAMNTGVGRNAMAGILARVFAGYTALSVNLERVLESGFNEELSCKVLAVVDEIRVGGHEQWDQAERFKQTITEEHRTINVKYGPKSLEFNVCRWLIFSNHLSALPLTDTDRRVEVVISNESPREPDYYRRLYADVSDPLVIAAFAKFLGDRDIRNFDPGRRAKTTGDKTQVVEFSRSELQTNLVEFTKDYPFELVTASRLQRAADVSGFGGAGKQYTYAVQDAGWEKLGKVSVAGGQAIAYARRGRLSYWLANKSNARAGLPKQDGGLAEWSGGGSDLFAV